MVLIYGFGLWVFIYVEEVAYKKKEHIIEEVAYKLIAE